MSYKSQFNMEKPSIEIKSSSDYPPVITYRNPYTKASISIHPDRIRVELKKDKLYGHFNPKRVASEGKGVSFDDFNVGYIGRSRREGALKEEDRRTEFCDSARTLLDELKNFMRQEIEIEINGKKVKRKKINLRITNMQGYSPEMLHVVEELGRTE